MLQVQYKLSSINIHCAWHDVSYHIKLFFLSLSFKNKIKTTNNKAKINYNNCFRNINMEGYVFFVVAIQVQQVQQFQ